jgi:RNA polymerase sigma factor (sigma-70 family)
MFLNQTETLPSSDLTNKAKQGDTNALGILIEYYRPLLLDISYKNIGRNSQSEDIVEDAILLSFSEKTTLKESGSFASWLLSHYYTSLSNYYELNSKVVFLEGEDFQKLLMDELDLDEVNKHFKKIASKKNVWDSLAVLDQNHKAIIILWYFGDYTSLQEVATILEITKEEVKDRLDQARILLYKRA